MKILKVTFRVLLMLFLFVGLLLVPGSGQVASALPVGAVTVVYNLYATDGYTLAADDFHPIYTYGFIGGREGRDVTYQPSPVSFDPLTVQYVAQAPGNVTVPAAVFPAPQGGPWTNLDAQLAGNAQFPAPIIYATTADVVEIRLKNLGIKANPAAPNDPHSIHLHGLDVDAANDGVPETSVGAVPANLCADGTTGDPVTGACPAGYAPGAGNVIVYMFTTKNPGTYMYHCHQEADIHVNMGMYGALVIYNPTDPGAVNGPGSVNAAGVGGGNLWGFQYDRDYIMLLSEFDQRGHQDEERTYHPESWDPDPYNWAMYQAQYWFINGLSFPQTIHAGFPPGYDWNQWIAAHPGYDPLIVGSVSKPNAFWRTPGEKVLIRVINLGFETQPMHMHGFHGKILGNDQRAWSWGNSPGNTSPKNVKPPTPFGQGLEKNTLLIGSGETYEWLVDFGQQKLSDIYPAGTQSRYDPATSLPVVNGNTAMPAIPEAGSTDPLAHTYVGGPDVSPSALNPGSVPDVLTGGMLQGQLFPFHNHDDYKATNNGTYPGGMFTMLMTLP